VNPVTEAFTPLAGLTSNGRFTGGFADVYIDLDLSGTISDGDLKINDTFLLDAQRLGIPGSGRGRTRGPAADRPIQRSSGCGSRCRLCGRQLRRSMSRFIE
jgi:hypothetical protein